MKQLIFTFINIIITSCALAQGISKNGKLTSTGTEYVDKNGTVGSTTGVNKNGKIVISDPSPVLTTTAVTAATGTQATSGGEVTAIGASNVTERGVCFSQTSLPNITGNGTIVIDATITGTGTGSFTSSITGLTPNTTYYLRAYATNGSATAYGSQQTFKTTNIQVGDTYQGGKIFYFFVSGDFGYIEGETHGLISAISDLPGGNRSWGCTDTNIPGISRGIGYGKQNTAIIVAACPGTTNSATYLCSELVQGGYDDWYLPSQDEYTKLFSVRLALSIGLGSRHWTSTQHNQAGYETDNAIFMQANGAWGTTYKGNTYAVHAIRSF